MLLRRLFAWLRPRRRPPEITYPSTRGERDEIAGRIYRAWPPIFDEAARERMRRDMTPRELALLDQWERENPPPKYPWERDWKRWPEDPYE